MWRNKLSSKHGPCTPPQTPTAWCSQEGGRDSRITHQGAPCMHPELQEQGHPIVALGSTEVRPKASWPAAHRQASTKLVLSRRGLCSRRKVLLREPGVLATNLPPFLPGKPRLPQLLQLHQRPGVGPPWPSPRAAQGASAEVHLHRGWPVSD